MIRSLGLLAAFVAFSAASGQDLQGRTWTPLAFHVLKPEGAVNAIREMERGTRVIVRLELSGQQYIVLDPGKCKLDSFTDDKNTDLLAAPAPRGGFLRPRISAGGLGVSDGRPNDITFHAPGCLAKGATKVRIKGTLSVLVGKDEKQAELKDVVLKAGAKLEFGTLKLWERTGAAVGPAKRDETFVEYEGKRPLTAVTLVDADGKEIPCRLSLSYRPPADGAYRAMFILKGNKIDRCAVRVKYFDTVEEITIPVDLEVGPGL
jgi:hypothetical protein